MVGRERIRIMRALTGLSTVFRLATPGGAVRRGTRPRRRFEHQPRSTCGHRGSARNRATRSIGRFGSWSPRNDGLWLSLVERCVRDAEAVGSNPTSPMASLDREVAAPLLLGFLGSAFSPCRLKPHPSPSNAKIFVDFCFPRTATSPKGRIR